MPLTEKGEKILANLEKEYGKEKAKEVLYAGKNSGRFTGIDKMKLPTRDAYSKAFQMAMDKGLPISDCIAAGLNAGRTTDKATTMRRAIRDGLNKGLTADAAIKAALKACK